MTRPAPILGEALRHWRDRLSPADVGLSTGAGRRSPGLRREELAQLAGLSVDYVVRLEQGRARHPSAQVLGSLTRALRLSKDERDFLYRCAGLAPPPTSQVSEHVPSGVHQIMTRLEDFPLALFSPAWQLITWNRLWAALHGDPRRLPVRDRNLVRVVFGAPDGNALRTGRSAKGPEHFRAALVADLRSAVAAHPLDDRLAELVAALRRDSADFERMWRTGQVAGHMSDRKTVEHPQVGEITLDCDVLAVSGSELKLVLYTAAAGSEDAGKLDLLRVLPPIPEVPRPASGTERVGNGTGEEPSPGQTR